MTKPEGIARDQLRSFIDRILRLKEEQDAIGGDVREVYAEAKSNGYDKTALGQVVTILRKKGRDPSGYAEHSALVDIYLAALGELPGEDRVARTRPREIIEEFPPEEPAHDPVTGEIEAASGGAGLAAVASAPAAERGEEIGSINSDRSEAPRRPPGHAAGIADGNGEPMPNKGGSHVADNRANVDAIAGDGAGEGYEIATPDDPAPVAVSAPRQTPDGFLPDEMEIPDYLRRAA